MTPFMYAALTALIWGIVPIFEKLGLRQLDPTVGLFYRCVGVVAGMLGLMVFFLMSGLRVKADVTSILFVGVGGFMASVIGQFIFYRALKTGSASMVVPIAAAYPLITCIIAVAVFHEQMTMSKLFGIGMIIAGTFLLR